MHYKFWGETHLMEIYRNPATFAERRGIAFRKQVNKTTCGIPEQKDESEVRGTNIKFIR